ncbi:AMP-binding protein [Roseomonas frigidaquae]|uniref:AMP-binding protein n=1 Tax=Falsiroseomonas frigidaquae TaxID=487318 RepID=A0ABX1EVJ6_9PROT|nr:AMP-binding protein [Falsiroseomonas frigidaquae]NKE44238.1 AMP-binding protein [Falsiroseomonas frigidaquae]
MPTTLPVAALSDAALLRLLRSLLPQELGGAGGRAITPAKAAVWPAELSLGAEGLGLDSLELVTCAAAVNELFRLHESGVEDYLLAERRLDAWCHIIRAGMQDGTTGITFRTSGSSGAPRRFTHAHAALAAEAAHWAGIFADRRRIIQLVPAHHIYGFLFTILLPEALGVPVVDGRALSPGRLARLLRGDDLLVGFPAGWTPMLRSLDRLPDGIRATSSTAPLPAATHHALREAGAAQVVEVYGSSETAGLAARSVPEAPFALLPRWRPGQAGEAASVIEVATGAEIALPDRCEWLGGGTLRLLGRKDDAVQVGGVNVYPARVAARLAAHPLVSDAAVRLDATLPEPRLKAFVTLHTPRERAGAHAALEAWCRENLPAAERPVSIELGGRLPRNALGKLSDWASAGTSGAASAAAPH